MTHTLIECRNVWKLFGNAPLAKLRSLGGEASPEALRAQGLISAVNNVSLSIAKGEMLVVMGLSGSGKSTFVRCVSRLIEITSGEVLIEGTNIGKLNERELIELRRSKMGMVFQGFGLLPHRTVLENVAFPLEMRGQNVHDRRDRALEVIKLVGLEGREDYFPRELSGGQQQRVGIARSLAIEPDIWFLDEPFSALDPLIRKEMQDEFIRLQAMLGKTIVFITHDFDEALRLADRIAIMKDGVVEQCDTPEQIVLNPATPYVAKFTEEIAKSRVVRAQGLLATQDTHGLSGDPIEGKATIGSLGRQLVDDARDMIPVADEQGKLLGAMDRQAALRVLLDA